MPQSSDLQKFCLRWNDYRSSVTAAFEGLRQDEELLDMTLCCEGKKIKAHRVMLSACSPFFRELLKENPCQHPVFMLRDVSYRDLWSAIEFVYKGEVNVRQADLATFLKTAEMLQLGLPKRMARVSCPIPRLARGRPSPTLLGRPPAPLAAGPGRSPRTPSSRPSPPHDRPNDRGRPQTRPARLHRRRRRRCSHRRSNRSRLHRPRRLCMVWRRVPRRTARRSLTRACRRSSTTASRPSHER
ncbi:protein bric-a-brac 1-like [Amphibalanus amphitrite]|uniref:protein bric-a-brac 1-like n=1 Tax=Amphibalanus amphitrite TaxID=1232801 RepID=UPI001C914845|nr:protein bric-a-brac 1-like [Amphibalanus amphitrite]XP_043192144.1 protein bric-a-brac 1-like [Amphibalanus amphitrite]XP_043192145.1 protein bric-a-brac 1-like [Amphibalanus amphitrite]XP_043192147.1 protein bric-a-brac 1-like [Amphibalanus amphitrite]